MKSHDRNPSDPEDDANYFAPLTGYLSELRASMLISIPDRFVVNGCGARQLLFDDSVMSHSRTIPLPYAPA
jgi:hypothetical protein